mmetsp:Transcript_103196/g.181898  ORF Transcript_103196/g.181898 Transcript_103196/m.181898 type:complete len:228 (-) Transcript_103196:94-777(-)
MPLLLSMSETLLNADIKLLPIWLALVAIVITFMLWRHCRCRSERNSGSKVDYLSEACFEANYVQNSPHAVVFLDVDGVLNSLLLDDPLDLAPGQVDPRCVQRLATLLQISGAALVLSSSWRSSKMLKRLLLEALLCDGSIPADLMVGQTPEIPVLQRAHEIRVWIELHPDVRAWVALDDMDVAVDDPAFFEGRFVHIDPETGLTDNDVKEALKSLASQSCLATARVD